MNFRTLSFSILLCALFSFGFGLSEPSPSLIQSGETAFFPKSTLEKMIKRSGCDAIRFYSAKQNVNGQASILAVCVSQDADMPVKNQSATKYQLFSGIQNGTPSMARLSKQQADGAVKNMKDQKLAVTMNNSELQQMLRAEGSTGIKLTRSTTENGQPTFLFSSATLSGTSVVDNTRKVIRVGNNPCPPSCGSIPRDRYLSAFSE